MARKDVPTLLVLRTVRDMQHDAIASPAATSAAARLVKATGECEKVVYAALERDYDRGLIECGVSLRWPWLTEKGELCLAYEEARIGNTRAQDTTVE